jgi:hypothetical protein
VTLGTRLAPNLLDSCKHRGLDVTLQRDLIWTCSFAVSKLQSSDIHDRKKHNLSAVVRSFMLIAIQQVQGKPPSVLVV